MVDHLHDDDHLHDHHHIVDQVDENTSDWDKPVQQSCGTCKRQNLQLWQRFEDQVSQVKKI